MTSVEASWIYESFGAVFVSKRCQGDGEESRWNPRIFQVVFCAEGKGLGELRIEIMTH